MTEASSSGMRALCRILNARSPDAAIRSACIQLLEKCGIDDPPVPLSPLLEALDVEFSWSRHDPHWKEGRSSASLQLKEGKAAIFVHEDLARQRWRRTRFSIAHELVHALLYRVLDDRKLSESLDQDEDSYQQLERICNLGASEILMPSHMIRPLLRRYSVTPVGLSRLYDNFLVSQNSLIWKISSVLPGTCVTRWRKHARHDGEEVEPRVVSCYPPYGSSAETPWLPSGATTSHIRPDIITPLIEDGKACYSKEFLVRLDDRRNWSGASAATFFEPRQSQDLPLFKGIEIPDETPNPSARDAVLFVRRHGASTNLPWSD